MRLHVVHASVTFIPEPSEKTHGEVTGMPSRKSQGLDVVLPLLCLYVASTQTLSKDSQTPFGALKSLSLIHI